MHIAKQTNQVSSVDLKSSSSKQEPRKEEQRGAENTPKECLRSKEFIKSRTKI